MEHRRPNQSPSESASECAFLGQMIGHTAFGCAGERQEESAREGRNLNEVYVFNGELEEEVCQDSV